MNVTHTIGSAIIHLAVENQLALVDVVGPFCLETCKQLMRAIVPGIRLAHPIAAVVFYDQAVLLDPVSTLHTATIDHAADGVIVKTPTAVVVRPEDLAATQAHCRAMNISGIHRAAFTCRSKAITWAARRAAIIQTELVRNAAQNQFAA